MLNGEFETALYGAAGVAHHAEMTRLLLARGANPNDEEVAYHSPETRDNSALRLLRVELRGVDRLVAACAMGDAPTVRSIAKREPHLVGEVVAMAASGSRRSPAPATCPAFGSSSISDHCGVFQPPTFATSASASFGPQVPGS